jgi:hypothetical protein
MAEQPAICRENLAAFTGWINAVRPAYQYVFFLDESASTDASHSMQQKALPAAGEVLLAIALLHASWRRRYRTGPLCPDLGNVTVM